MSDKELPKPIKYVKLFILLFRKIVVYILIEEGDYNVRLFSSLEASAHH